MLQVELKKLELEERMLSLRSAGVVGQTPGGSSGPPPSFDVSMNLRLVSQFCEGDTDTFFSLFERVAETRGWSDAERTLLLQCVLTGKAQEAYCALGVAGSRVYISVKAAVLKAYELVPEAYRQRFRSWEKSGRQTHMEFARELSTHFHRWCSSLNVHTFDALCELVILEQFKDSVPPHIAVYISEHKVRTAEEAAALADDYVLTHHGDYDYRAPESGKSRMDRSVQNQTQGDQKNICHYCRGRGHWKAECPLKGHSESGQVEPVALAAPGRRLTSVLSTGVSSRRVKGESAGDYGRLQSDFSAFVSNGYVSLVGSDVKYQLKS
ncbi:uncharacterized protein LOC118470711 [Amphiprion ocellaris]|uniref:uncharacterized protein LOC118470711 n=1 Tax=Amphiprion ocellaris TaxID=80972 RepID=UPI002410B7D5|nr:uncharacterized protein LOC118470711 [Amphiprion ocellaris]